MFYYYFLIVLRKFVAYGLKGHYTLEQHFLLFIRHLHSRHHLHIFLVSQHFANLILIFIFSYYFDCSCRFISVCLDCLSMFYAWFWQAGFFWARRPWSTPYWDTTDAYDLYFHNFHYYWFYVFLLLFLLFVIIIIIIIIIIFIYYYHYFYLN